ncbi:helix-turn-helix domain-containing protein [Thermoflexibacter ruber]|uniref:Transcriptional regulator, contains XRE-family HTH domain n=1 Tax=Thermoflexibacter ruber TaxID=1003 RepID=A0A1I2HQU4_9BACT|nr:helix-turn-helix transcriptional regulator [Thermoflexibacter ruber]SFF31888.1 Transcriptional regulator, contains XRE-family HTH domain [Thermoflexibacter ruber]
MPTLYVFQLPQRKQNVLIFLFQILPYFCKYSTNQVGNFNQNLGMKIKIGNKLMWEREERRLNQTEMANLLGLSQSAYSRLERNETSIEIEQIVNFAKKLQVPIQEFLPETFAIHSNNDNGQVGFVIGNYYNYSDKELAQENQFLKEKIQLLEGEIKNLKEMLNLLKG